ncbi:MAG TPA: MarC family protein [Dongiaceae bacterium]|nr:MarC family protein [Dongiaceae bacterium]
MDFVATTLLLFIVLDPLGNIPLYLSQLRAVPEARRRYVVIRELILAYFVLLFFLFAGPSFMKVLALDIASVRIAGGVVLFLIALRMVFPPPGPRHGTTEVNSEPFIVPLAVPAVAGPAALSVVVLLREANPTDTMLLLGAMSTAWFISAIILAGAAYLQRMLRNEGILAMERLMGLVLVVIAIQMMIDALRSLGALPAHV